MEKTLTGIELITQERQRQKDVEGWNDLHDDGHRSAEMAGAAACYITSALNKLSDGRFRFERFGETESGMLGEWFDAWPWDSQYDKRNKHDVLRSLTIAGALIAAEIDRIQATNPE